jgi:ech hydrogenase subunit E
MRPSWARTRDVGVMTPSRPSCFGAVGPTARASGVERDIRVDAPVRAYPDFPVSVVTGTRGDLEARLWCASRSCLKPTA